MTVPLRPTADRVFIRPLTDDGTIGDTGLVRPVANTFSREGVLLHTEGDEKFINQGIVAALGDGVLLSSKFVHFVNVGDHVVFSPYSATHLTIAGETLLVVREGDIEAVVED